MYAGARAAPYGLRCRLTVHWVGKSDTSWGL
jgi:hypothetical protein